MIPIPVMQFINFFQSTVIDNVNILKINVQLKHQCTVHFEKILHKLPLCTLTIVTLTTTLAIIWRLRFNVRHVKEYFVTWLKNGNDTCTMQKKRDARLNLIRI